MSPHCTMTMTLGFLTKILKTLGWQKYSHEAFLIATALGLPAPLYHQPAGVRLITTFPNHHTTLSSTVNSIHTGILHQMDCHSP